MEGERKLRLILGAAVFLLVAVKFYPALSQPGLNPAFMILLLGPAYLAYTLTTSWKVKAACSVFFMLTGFYFIDTGGVIGVAGAFLVFLSLLQILLLTCCFCCGKKTG